MHRDTTIALSGNRYGKSDQFTSLGIQVAGLRAGIIQCAKPANRVGADFCHFANSGKQLLPLFIPIVYHFLVLRSSFWLILSRPICIFECLMNVLPD
jgi:hypothetical protein